MAGATTPIFVRFILDISTEFPYHACKTTKQWSETAPARSALDLLDEDEQKGVLKYVRPCDAALHLGSQLLKRLFVLRTCSVQWSKSQVTASPDINNGKPYRPNFRGDFNVSHHGDLVVLVGTNLPGHSVGIDVVKIDLAKDKPEVMKKGFDKWVRTYEQMFSEAELVEIITSNVDDDEDPIEMQLRTFYAHWALKEAYIKMTSEAMFASWLQQLEFRNVTSPARSDLAKGFVPAMKYWVNSAYLNGVYQTDCEIELLVWGPQYLIVTALNQKPGTRHFPPFEGVQIAEHVLPLATLPVEEAVEVRR
jgi:4'-phosphopantetheinyl transferase